MSVRAYGPGEDPNGADAGKVMFMRAWDVWDGPGGSETGPGENGMAFGLLGQTGEREAWTDMWWQMNSNDPENSSIYTGHIRGIHTPGGPFGEPGDGGGDNENAEGLSYGVNYNVTQIPPPGNRPPDPKTVLALDYYLLVAMDPGLNEPFDQMFSMTYVVDAEGQVIQSRQRHVVGGVHKGNVLFVDGTVRLMEHAEINPDDHPDLWNLP